MNNFSSRHRVILAIILLVVTIGIAAWIWLKTPYAFPETRQTAENFLHLINNGNTEEAYDLTLKNIYTGNTLAAFQEIAAREICGPELQPVSMHPQQTNGNRLRRYLNSRDIEMPVVNIEFSTSHPCLFKITLHHTDDGNWKIFKFGRHAG